jgi:hypothetical protein
VVAKSPGLFGHGFALAFGEKSNVKAAEPFRAAI